MGLLQERPTSEQISSMLGPVMGDEAAGTGVAGALRLLEGIDTSGSSVPLAAQLVESISGSVAIATSGLMGGVSYEARDREPSP